MLPRPEPSQLPKPEYYDAFVELPVEANERGPMRILGWCLMPNRCPA
jgi:hypothetical protein